MFLSQLDHTTTTSRSAWFPRYFQPIFQKSIRKLRRLKTEGITVTGFGDFRRWALASRSPSPVTKIKLTNPEQRRKWQKPNKFAMLDKNRPRKDKNTNRIYEARISNIVSLTESVERRVNLFEMLCQPVKERRIKSFQLIPVCFLITQKKEGEIRNKKIITAEKGEETRTWATKKC